MNNTAEVGKEIGEKEFYEILGRKKRGLRFSRHSSKRAKERGLPQAIVEADIYSGKPLKILEQKCETPGERKFNLYYLQLPGYYHRYVIVLNDEMRIITVIRTSKDLQKIVAGEKQ